MNAVIVIMGVSGSGKSVVGALLAHRLAVAFCEGDALHPAAKIAKMKVGQPLDDADRAPWLDEAATWIAAQRQGGVVSCSALKRAYRDRLRFGQAVPPAFVLLDPTLADLERHMARPDHVMPPRLLDSQLATLKRPALDERALRIAMTQAPSVSLRLFLPGWLAKYLVNKLANNPERT